MRVGHAVLAFGVELAMLAALGVFGFWVGGDGLLGWVLAIGVVLVVVGAWSVWLAPKAMRPPERRVALLIKGVLFLASALLVGVAGHLAAGIALAVAAAVSVGLEVALGPAADGYEGLTP